MTASHHRGPSAINKVISTLVHEGFASNNVSQYRDCLRCIDYVIPTDNPKFLADVIIELDTISQFIPWALEDWSKFLPELSAISALRQCLDARLRLPVPDEHLEDFPLLAGLRRHSNHKHYDFAARSLLISLALRTETGSEISPYARSSTQSSHPSIRVLSSRIRGLNKTNIRREQGPRFKSAYNETESAEEYLVALSKLCIATDPKDLDLHKALTTDGFSLFGLNQSPPVEPTPPPLPPSGGPGPSVSIPKSETLEDDELTAPSTPSIVINAPVAVLVDDDETPEALDESTVEVAHVTNQRPTSKAPSFQELRGLIRRGIHSQNISAAGELFLTPHIEALTGHEVRTLGASLVKGIRQAIDNHQLDRAVDLCLLSLVLCTGLTPGRLLRLLHPEESSDSLALKKGKVFLKTMLPESAFNPQPEQPLINAVSRFEIELPPSIASLLCELRSHFNMPFTEEAVINRLGTALQEAKDLTGLPYLTVGRVRKTHAALLHAVSPDYCSVATLAQDRFRQSPAPLHYYSSRTEALADIYRKAIWTVFGENPYLAATNSKLRSGSRALPIPEASSEAAKTALKPLHSPTRDNHTSTLARTHNALTAHVLTMLLSVCGHRPSSSLFELTRWDFDTELGAAILADKISDAAHLRRIIGLGSSVAKQISFYLLHLDELSKTTDSKPLRRKIKAILRGQESLFFKVDNEGNPKPSSLTWLWEQVDSCPDIPKNWGRHYLGSFGRELTNQPYLVSIQLGHFESVGYPFSPDSPLCPRQFIESVNPLLDEVFVKQGWTLQKGLARGRSETRTKSPTEGIDSWSHTGPLVDWERSNQAFSAEAKKRNLAVRRSRWRVQHAQRHETEQAVINIAASIDSDLAQLLAYKINERQRKQLKKDATFVTLPGKHEPAHTEPSKALEGSDEAVNSLFELISEHFKDRQTALIAHNTAARALSSAHQQGFYKGVMHWPWLALRVLDVSPFTPGLFRAYRQLRALHRHLERGVAEFKGKKESQDKLAGIAALSLAIHGGIDNEELLYELTFGNCNSYLVPSVPGGIVVHSSSLEHSVGFRGIAALAYTSWRHRGAQNFEQQKNLDDVLRSILPAGAFGKRTRITKALCSTVAMANRVMHSGMANLALSLKDGCTCFDERRLKAILCGQEEPAIVPQLKTVSDNLGSSSHTVKEGEQAKTLAKEYKYLRGLYKKNENVELKYSGEVWRFDYKERTMEREKIVREVELLSKNQSWSWFGKLWSSWLAYELKRPKLVGPGDELAYSSVFGNFGEAAGKMRALLAKGPSSSLRSYPTTALLENLYGRILENSPQTTQQRICSTLMSFHRHVSEELGIDDIDPSDYWEYWRPNRKERAKVRTWIPNARDVKLMDEELLRLADPEEDSRVLENIDRRRIRQAYLAFRLAADSGCRVGELLALRSIDAVLAEDNYVAISIRPNRFRRLKTRSARRLIELSPCQSLHARTLLKQHLESETNRVPARLRSHVWIFSDESGRPVATHKIRSIVDQVAMCVIGRTLPWHSLRHHHISDRLVRLLIGIGLSDLSTAMETPASYLLLMPRDAACEAAEFGHARIRTSLTSYFHAPWVFQLREHDSSLESPGSVAAVMNITISQAYARLRNAGSLHGLVIETHERINPSSKGKTRIEPNLSPIQVDAAQSAARLCHAMHTIGNGVEIHHVKLHPGVTAAELVELERADGTLAATTSIGIFRENPNASKRFSRPPRWPKCALPLQRLWESLEILRDPQTLRLVEIWQLHASRGLRHGLRTPRNPRSNLVWPAENIAVLESAVADCGLHIRKLEQCESICAVRVENSQGRNLSGQAAWVLAIGWVVHSARAARESSTNPAST